MISPAQRETRDLLRANDELALAARTSAIGSVAAVRGDGCDADCSRTPDADGDDWPDDADCNPNDASVFPCSDAEQPDDDVDSDCDGEDEARLDTCLGWDPDYDTSEQVRFTAENCPCPAPAFGGCGIAE